MNYDDPPATTLETEGDAVEEPPSERVIRAVSDRKGIDPTALQPPLYDAINPEALDSLFETRDTDGRVEFHWLGYRIVVFSSGSVRVIE